MIDWMKREWHEWRDITRMSWRFYLLLFGLMCLAALLCGCIHVRLPNGASYTAVGTNTQIGLAVYNPETQAFLLMDYAKVTDPNMAAALKKFGIGAAGFVAGGAL